MVGWAYYTIFYISFFFAITVMEDLIQRKDREITEADGHMAPDLRLCRDIIELVILKFENADHFYYYYYYYIIHICHLKRNTGSYAQKHQAGGKSKSHQYCLWSPTAELFPRSDLLVLVPQYVSLWRRPSCQRQTLPLYVRSSSNNSEQNISDLSKSP